MSKETNLRIEAITWTNTLKKCCLPERRVGARLTTDSAPFEGTTNGAAFLDWAFIRSS